MRRRGSLRMLMLSWEGVRKKANFNIPQSPEDFSEPFSLIRGGWLAFIVRNEIIAWVRIGSILPGFVRKAVAYIEMYCSCFIEGVFL